MRAADPLPSSGDPHKLHDEQRTSAVSKYEMSQLFAVIRALNPSQSTSFVAFETMCYKKNVFFWWGLCGGLALTDEGVDAFNKKIDISYLFDSQRAYVETGILPVISGRVAPGSARPVPLNSAERFQEVVAPFEAIKRSMIKDLDIHE